MMPSMKVARSSALRFTAEGKADWQSFMNFHEGEINTASFPYYLLGPYQKLKSYCARIALILHLARFACGETTEENVDEVSVQKAIKVINYFKSHLRRTYQHLRGKSDNGKVKALNEFLVQNGGSATIREFITLKIAGCGNKAAALELLEPLVKKGMGEFVTTRNKSGGKPTIRFVLTPQNEQ